MNQKIKELIKLSYVEVPHERDWDAMSSVFNKEKFAELIVRECCNVCERLQDSLDRQNWPTPYECAVGIKEHFGIEE